MPQLQMNTRQSGDVTVVDFSGAITLSVASHTVRDAVRELVSAGNRKTLLNMRHVAYIDSYGIGELVAGYSSLRNAGGTLKLLSPTKHVKDMLVITNLYNIFDVQENEETGILSFAA